MSGKSERVAFVSEARAEFALASLSGKPGWKTPYEQATLLAIEAWSKHSTPDSEGARRDYVTSRLTVDAVWAVIERSHPLVKNQSIRSLLEQAAWTIREQAYNAPDKTPKEELFFATRDLKSQILNAATATMDLDSAHPEVEFENEIDKLADKQGETARAIYRSRIEQFSIDGKPLAECTAREALSWCHKQEVSIDFVRVLCHGVPLDDILGRWYGNAEAEVEEIWKRVNSEEARDRRALLRQKAYEEWEKAAALAKRLGKTGEAMLEKAKGPHHRWFDCSVEAVPEPWTSPAV